MLAPPPDGWPRISSALWYRDPAAAITWLEQAFGFVTRLKVEGPDGAILHSELDYGEGLIMVGAADPSKGRASPRAFEGLNTQSLHVHVPNVDAHCAHARAQGAKILTEPMTSDYGEEYWSDRCYEAEDPEGHRWFFAHRIRTGSGK